jgi:hypothetical protein
MIGPARIEGRSAIAKTEMSRIAVVPSGAVRIVLIASRRVGARIIARKKAAVRVGEFRETTAMTASVMIARAMINV